MNPLRGKGETEMRQDRNNSTGVSEESMKQIKVMKECNWSETDHDEGTGNM